MLDLESVGTFGPPFIPFNPNTLGNYGIGTQQPSTSGRKGQDPVVFERSISEGGGGNEVTSSFRKVYLNSLWTTNYSNLC